MTKDDNLTGKQEILCAARQLFMTKGYVNTTMDDIADVVGLTKGGVYYYVDKKEDLLVGIHQEMMDGFFKVMVAAIEGENDPIIKLDKWIKIYVELLKEYQPHVKIFFTEIRQLPEDSYGKLVEQRKRVKDMLQKILLFGIAENKFRNDMDANITSVLILGMLNWMYLWYKPTRELSLNVIIENINKLVFNGISLSIISEGSDNGCCYEKVTY